MTDRLREARRDGRDGRELMLEDFMGMHLWEGHGRGVLHRPDEDWHRQMRFLTLLKLDGISYAFVFKPGIASWEEVNVAKQLGIDTGTGRLEKIVLAETLGLNKTAPIILPMPMPIDIRTEMDFWEDRHSYHRSEDLEAGWLYALSDAVDGKVVFEIGETITTNPHQVVRLSKFDPAGYDVPYLEVIDPDAIEPTPIVKGERPYEPKAPGFHLRRGIQRYPR